jgi:deazaflavin-dependent oxidoreductase (nitroreductase family)
MTELDNPVDPPEGWRRDHIRKYVASDGAEGYLWHGIAPTLLLTTRGRRSGTARRNGLIYGQDGDRYLVVASKGGSEKHPDWYRNLTANPRVRVQVKGDKFAARARTATPDEKAKLWPIMTKIWPDYDKYQTRTGRDIPVVILEPIR